MTFILHPYIKKCLKSIIFIPNEYLNEADISNRQRISAVFYLLGFLKKGLSYSK